MELGGKIRRQRSDVVHGSRGHLSQGRGLTTGLEAQVGRILLSPLGEDSEVGYVAVGKGREGAGMTCGVRPHRVPPLLSAQEPGTQGPALCPGPAPAPLPGQPALGRVDA